MMVYIGIIMILLIINLYANSKAMNDKTGKYRKLSDWIDVGIKTTVMVLLYTTILNVGHPPIIINILILLLSIIAVVVDLPIKFIRQQRFQKYRIIISLASFTIVAIYALAIIIHI